MYIMSEKECQLKKQCVTNKAIQRAPVKSATVAGIQGNLVYTPSTTRTRITEGVTSEDIYEGNKMVIRGLYSGNTVGGSSPSAATKKVSKAANKALGAGGKKYYIAGHLLNQRMGGRGDLQDNITALSYSSNGMHYSNIEKDVIDEIENDNIVLYEVNVTQRNLNESGNNVTVDGMASKMIAQYSLLDDTLGRNPNDATHYRLKRRVDFELKREGSTATVT